MLTSIRPAHNPVNEPSVYTSPRRKFSLRVPLPRRTNILLPNLTRLQISSSSPWLLSQTFAHNRNRYQSASYCLLACDRSSTPSGPALVTLSGNFVPPSLPLGPPNRFRLISMTSACVGPINPLCMASARSLGRVGRMPSVYLSLLAKYSNFAAAVMRGHVISTRLVKYT